MLRFTELLTLAYRTRVKSLLKGTFLYIVLFWDLPLYGEKIIKGLGKNRGMRERHVICWFFAFRMLLRRSMYKNSYKI